jgi:hypothetical protein
MSPEFDDVVNAFDEISTGGGYVGKTSVSFGWKLFPSGERTSLEDTYFPFDPKSQDDMHRAEKLAKQAVADHNWKKKDKEDEFIRPMLCAVLVIQKDGELTGRLKEWRTDTQFFAVPKFTQGYKEVLRPSFEVFNAAGINPLEKGKVTWTHIGVLPDPSGRERTKQDGTPTPIFVPYVVAVFNSEEEAKQYVVDNNLEYQGKSASAGAETGAPVDEDHPQGYTKKSWAATKADIKEAFAKGDTKETIATDYELSAEWVDKAVA